MKDEFKKNEKSTKILHFSSDYKSRSHVSCVNAKGNKQKLIQNVIEAGVTGKKENYYWLFPSQHLIPGIIKSATSAN